MQDKLLKTLETNPIKKDKLTMLLEENGHNFSINYSPEEGGDLKTGVEIRFPGFFEPVKKGKSSSFETTDTPLPVPSMEAYSILVDTSADKDIKNFVSIFKNLIDIENSRLASLSRHEPELKNQEFINELTEISQRIIVAIENRTPYRALFMDILRFQEQLQIMILYYQNQCDNGQPIANAYLERARQPGSQLMKTLFNPDKGSGINADGESLFIRYTLNYSAQRIMESELRELSGFIERPFLLDHSKEENFSYMP